MKVICINSKKPTGNYFKRPGTWRLKEGEIYTVLFCVLAEDPDGVLSQCYVLYEDPLNNEYTWDRSRFIPLSEIDELELVNEKLEECIT